MKYRKKPVVIEAYQLPGYDDAEFGAIEGFLAWAREVGFTEWTSERDGTIDIVTLEGTMTAQPSDWIIKGVKGEFYPCKPDIFEATYEPADCNCGAEHEGHLRCICPGMTP